MEFMYIKCQWETTRSVPYILFSVWLLGWFITVIGKQALFHCGFLIHFTLNSYWLTYIDGSWRSPPFTLVCLKGAVSLLQELSAAFLQVHLSSVNYPLSAVWLQTKRWERMFWRRELMAHVSGKLPHTQICVWVHLGVTRLNEEGPGHEWKQRGKKE